VAAICGELTAVMVGMAIVLRRFGRAGRVSRRRLGDRMAFLRMISLNRDIMIRSFLLLGAFAVFTRKGAAFGTPTLAANAILMNFYMASGFFLEGFAAAAEQLTGRAVGARHFPAFRRAISLTLVWGFVLAAVAALAILLLGDELIAIMTTSVEVRVLAGVFLPWAALVAVSGVLAFQMDGVFIGATWSRDMRNMMLLSALVFLAAAEFLPDRFGNAGLWASLHLFLIVRGVSLLAALPGRTRQTFPAGA